MTAPTRDADVTLPVADHARADRSLTWTVHLLRGRASRLPRIGGAVVLVFAGGWIVLHNPLLAVLPAGLLLLSLAEFLLPIRYTITHDRAQARQGLMLLEIAWTDVRHAYLDADGIKLSPLERRGSRLEPLRGVFLRFAGNDACVIDAVRRSREASHDV